MKISKSKILECVRGYPYLFVTPTNLEFYAYSEEKRITRVRLPFETATSNFRGCAYLDEKAYFLLEKIPSSEIEVSADFNEDRETNMIYFDDIGVELAVTAYGGDAGRRAG